MKKEVFFNYENFILSSDVFVKFIFFINCILILRKYNVFIRDNV